MFRLADSLGLAGFVRNDESGVWIEIEGEPPTVERFLDGLAGAAPPAARIDDVIVSQMPPVGASSFAIVPSDDNIAASTIAAAIPADLAPCDECLRELDDPADRRAGYPFINCTACGPRFTIVRTVPYDRPSTTMATFTMCDACSREYHDPYDRRFHAEPNACATCGPQLRLSGRDGVICMGPSALTAAIAGLADGAVVAIKGAGGFALAVDATNDAAVAMLRKRKRRPHKPFAVMARSLADLESIVELDDAARAALTSPVRPIVLVPARDPSSIAHWVAPGLRDLGVFLPPTPLQYLVAARGPKLLVMTSGNTADEPIACTDSEATVRLNGIADLFLLHDREIHARADDSVLRATRTGSIVMRRARGYVPDSIVLPIEAPPVLAVGGHERNTICLTRGGRAVLSQHVGDLSHPDSDTFFREAIAHLRELVGVEPRAIAHDLHPDYRSTRWALASGLPCIPVQHHHAHVAACLAEHGRTDRVIGVAFDGTGLGDDGTLWGGEILDADLTTSRRLAHLRPLALVGGEAAIHEPWRVAVAALLDAGESIELVIGVEPVARRRVAGAISHAPRATGAGRWFDAVGALLGVARAISYDGQAAAQLEALAAIAGTAPAFDFAIDTSAGTSPFGIDLRPAIRELARELRRGAGTASLAARFHETLAVAIRDACRLARSNGAPRTVVLTGGCFQNRILLERATSLLEQDGFEVLVHRKVPPNDGGLALGQAAIASFRIANEGSACV